jgi:hypothetical protein
MPECGGKQGERTGRGNAGWLGERSPNLRTPGVCRKFAHLGMVERGRQREREKSNEYDQSREGSQDRPVVRWLEQGSSFENKCMPSVSHGTRERTRLGLARERMPSEVRVQEGTGSGVPTGQTRCEGEGKIGCTSAEAMHGRLPLYTKQE